MIRLGLTDRGVGIWPGHGRGAYVHPIPDCVERALTKGRLERAFRRPVLPAERDALRPLLLCRLR